MNLGNSFLIKIKSADNYKSTKNIVELDLDDPNTNNFFVEYKQKSNYSSRSNLNTILLDTVAEKTIFIPENRFILISAKEVSNPKYDRPYYVLKYEGKIFSCECK